MEQCNTIDKTLQLLQRSEEAMRTAYGKLKHKMYKSEYLDSGDIDEGAEKAGNLHSRELTYSTSLQSLINR